MQPHAAAPSRQAQSDPRTAVAGHEHVAAREQPHYGLVKAVRELAVTALPLTWLLGSDLHDWGYPKGA